MVENLTKEYIRDLEDQYQQKIESLYSSLAVTDDRALEALLLQSLHGMAISGHGSFLQKQEKPNITQTQVVEALGYDPVEIRKYRQALIDEVTPCLTKILMGESNSLTNEQGLPLFRVRFLKDIKIEDPENDFKGVAMAGSMDSAYWRTLTQQTYKVNFQNRPLFIGCGKEHPINLAMQEEMMAKGERVSPLDLSTQEHEEFIQLYEEEGLIAKSCCGTHTEIENQYIRYRKGLGCNDDSCLISIGWRYGMGAMVLGFVIDAIDTYTKFACKQVPGGQDQKIAKNLVSLWEKKYKRHLATDREYMETILFGHKGYTPVTQFSSSHRRFIETEEGAKLPTFLEHLKFVKTGIPPRSQSKLGFERVSSGDFYSQIKKKIQEMGWHTPGRNFYDHHVI